MKEQDLKHRINGARETVKITRAMQLVSASKMTKAERRLVSAREFLSRMEEAVRKVGEGETKLTEKRQGTNKTFIVIAGDKGLCGDYNHRILEYAAELTGNDENVTVYTVGHFAREFFKKRKEKVNAKYVYLMQGAIVEEIRNFASDLTLAFEEGKTDEVILVYTGILENSVSHQELQKVRLLPFELPEQETKKGILEYKNDKDGILKQYIWAEIVFALYSAEYALNYKSMAAMQQATTNGEELVDELSLLFNRLRQEKITSELMDACSSVSPEEK